MPGIKKKKKLPELQRSRKVRPIRKIIQSELTQMFELVEDGIKCL
jgi:hypothetical protein